MQQSLNASLLEEFDRDGEIRHGLPGAAYVSDEFMHLENSHIFSRSWVFVAFAHKLPNAGDVLPINVGGQPLFILRNEAQEIIAFHNVCRHRNLKLIDQPHNCGRLIRCPYHSWSYDLRGQLKNAPFFGGEAKQVPADFDPAANGLMPVRCEVWHDWVFVNLDADGMSFDEFLRPILKQLGDNDMSQYRPVTTVEFGKVNTNWKLLMENFIEPYHVQFVHKTTTSQPLLDHYPVIEGHCLGSAVDLTEEQRAAAEGKGTLGVTSRYLTLFPNFVMGTYHPDQLGIHLNIPFDAETTIQSRVIYVHEDSDYNDEQIQALKDLWYRVHLEDHEMCERLQQGRHSALAAMGGILSPHWETSVRKFQELVANAIRPALVK
jgi:choline monooxygenase